MARVTDTRQSLRQAFTVSAENRKRDKTPLKGQRTNFPPVSFSQDLHAIV
jgi:hypothetical protein